MSDAALAGIRVVELASGIAGPFCARLLADQGADVLKVERPGSGDATRGWGPFPGDRVDREASGTFFFLNTSKRSVALDLAADRERLLGLIAGADVLVCDLPAGALREHDLGWTTLARRNPALVMLSLTPFGLTGPWAGWKGHDLNAYHLTACGTRYCGRPDAEPLEHGTFSAEFFAGYAAAAWGLACVLGRDRVGGGQHLDVSSAEVLAALYVGALNVGGYAQDGAADSRGGAGMGLAAPADIVPCKDGHVLLIALERAQWRGLREAMDDPAWARPELFDDMWERGRNADLIYRMLGEWTRQHSREEIMARCQAHGCPATAVYTVADLARHPHLQQRGHLAELEHPRLGRVLVPGPPIRLPACPDPPRAPAPLLDQHRDAPSWHPRAPRRQPTLPEPDDPALPLEGLRVANFGWGVVGPTAGQLLGFLGAEVYKIESRARPDIQRSIPPFVDGVSDPDRSIQNHAFWAGNRSVTLNLKTPEGRELARDLVSISDVVIENFGRGVMERLGLGYDVLGADRTDLIMASLSATGGGGCLSDLRTYGNSLSSLAGLDALTGYAGGPLQAMENAFADPLGGVIGALAVLLALCHRERTGRGQHVDHSQMEGILQLVGPAFMDHVLNGRVAGPIGNRHPTGAAAPHGVFPCRGEDRWIAIAVLTDEEWRGLASALGAWARDPALAEAAGRIRQIDALHGRIAAWTRDLDDHALARRLQRLGVAATPVLDVSELLDGEHYRARGTFIEVVHPLGFRETIYGAYVKTSRTRPDIRPGPAVGQDNDHVFLELLGLPLARYRELIERRVID